MNSKFNLPPTVAHGDKTFPKFRSELLGLNVDLILHLAEQDRERLPESTRAKYLESAKQRTRWALAAAIRGGWTREQLVSYLTTCEPETMQTGRQKP